VAHVRCAASLCDEQRTRTCSWGGSKSAVLSARYLYALSDVSWSAAWASTDTSCPTELEGAMVSAESVQEDVELPRGARHLGIARDRPPPRHRGDTNRRGCVPLFSCGPVGHSFGSSPGGLRRGHSIGGEGVQEQAALQAGDARTRVVHVRRQRRAASAYYPFKRSLPLSSPSHFNSSLFPFC
jgi:hypothetical protein